MHIVLLKDKFWNEHLLVQQEHAQGKKQGQVEPHHAFSIYVVLKDIPGIDNQNDREDEQEQPYQNNGHEDRYRVVQGFIFGTEEVYQFLFAAFKAVFLQAFKQSAFVMKELINGVTRLFFGHGHKIKSKTYKKVNLHDKFMTKTRFFKTKNKFNFCERHSLY